ncbi:hypothetical protein SEA_SAMPSON_84 [Gordonia Phage Sampson]|uniref:Uncharacterized protein n=1 Tax=Gordonia Phage Sampson TaxID=2951393 RepID=A0A9E7SY73_9CAUD|nr:hypothetical protein SEA_SAMPSON_84 [Gordonia Phage Sampson]
MIVTVGGFAVEYVRFTRCAECGKAIGDEVGQPGFGYWRHVVDDNSHHPKIPRFVGDNLPETIRAGGVDDDGLDNVTGSQQCRDCGHTRREHYRGRSTCMYARPDSQHGFDCPCGEYVEPVVLEQPVPELVAAEVACAWCDAIYPDESHDPQCATYGTLTPLENRIAETIHAHAFVPLHDRYAIARHLIAEGWRPRT